MRSALPEVCLELERRHRALASQAREDAGELVIPDVVGCDSDEGLFAVEWLRGDSLLEALWGNSTAVLRRVAAALHSFHQLPLSACPDLPTIGPDALAGRVRAATEDLAGAYPMLRRRSQTLADEFVAAVEALADVPPVLLHNDFHWNQVTIKAERVVVLDLERIGPGDALLDVANFVTQLRMLPVRGEHSVAQNVAEGWARTFLDEWQRAASTPVNPTRMRLFSVVALLELARGMMRHLRPGAAALAETCLDRCDRALAGEAAEVGR